MSARLKRQRREELEREQRRRRLIYGSVAVVLIVGLGAIIYFRFLQSIPGVEDLGALDRGHAENVDIGNEPGLPPAGGIHNPRWLNCGVYREPVEDGLAVHSLEHGAVWIAYDPDLPSDQIASLEAYGDNFTIVAPYPELQTDVVATAWGKRLLIDELPDDRIDDFITRFQGQGPEPGAPCTGGVGTPVRLN